MAASDDLTGHASLGGDWGLEYEAGDIEADIIVTQNARLHWQGVLDTTTGLVGHWTLDSDATDTSGNGHDGTLGGHATIDTTLATNKVGSGKLSLDGTVRHVHVVLTHYHWDHIQGFPFFKPAYDPEQRINILALGADRGITDLKEIFAIQMQETFFPVALEGMGARFSRPPLRA